MNRSLHILVSDVHPKADEVWKHTFQKRMKMREYEKIVEVQNRNAGECASS